MGIKLNPKKVLEGNGKKAPAYFSGLMALIMVACYALALKSIEPATNIVLTGGVIIYSFTFLAISIICKYYGFKEARKAIFISALLYVSFFVIMSIGLLPKANSFTTVYNSFVQYIFCSEFIDISSDITLFYPELGQFFSILIAFVVGHLVYATVYNAISRYTVDYLSMGLSLFIAYIVDRLIFVPILFAKSLQNGSNTFDFVIKLLTSEFIAAILLSIIIVICYIVITSIKKED